MPGFASYSATPGDNTSINGINIAENCPPGNLNGAVRQFMADARAEHDALPDTSGFMLKAAGTFSGTQPVYTGRGAYLHHNSASLTSGRIFMQASGGAVPTGMTPGDILLEY